MIRKILLGLLVALILIQFIPVNRETPPAVPDMDFIAMTNPPENVRLTLEKACYDCHSYKTAYPWYSKVAPISFWIDQHIDDGRGHLNFAEWGTYDAERQDHKLEELIEEVDEGEMPLDSYTWIHDEARLTQDETSSLIQFVEQLRSTY